MIRFQSGLAFVVCSLLANCATTTATLRSAAVTSARIAVVDKPNYQNELYRYVQWNGEDYGPGAFVAVAKGQGIDSIELTTVDDNAMRCAAALTAELGVPIRVSGDSNVPGTVVQPSAETVEQACTIEYEVPHPELGEEQYYVVSEGGDVAIEGQPPVGPEELVGVLRRLEARAIVLRKATIAELLCFGAIAGAANVQLLQVNRDGTLGGLVVRGASVAEACSKLSR